MADTLDERGEPLTEPRRPPPRGDVFRDADGRPITRPKGPIDKRHGAINADLAVENVRLRARVAELENMLAEKGGYR